MAHFGGGGLGEGDGYNLAGVFHLGQKTEKAAGEQIGLARAGGGLNEDGVGGIEGALALGLIGRRSLGHGLTHRRPPRRLHLNPLRDRAARDSPRCDTGFQGRNARRSWDNHAGLLRRGQRGSLWPTALCTLSSR